jgi:TolB-like protein/class 3 adenylate cyclase
MFTDMVGYTALSQRNEPLALELLEEHRRILRSIFPRFNGTEIKTIGDAFLVEFQSALEAAQCALEIQRTLAKRNHDVSPERRIELRIGIHVGDVVHREGDVYGDGVNIASRIQPVAGIGGICISVDVERQIHNALEARFEKLAPVELKNVEVPMDLFRIVLPWERDTRLTAQPQKTAHGATRRRIPWHEVVLAVLLVAALIVGGFFFLRHRAPQQARNSATSQPVSSSEAAVPEKSIAVLPFENLSEEKQNEYFTEGVQDQILGDLAQIADLKVISRTSVMQYKSGAPRNLRDIGQQLGVARVVEGSVQRAGNRVRVTAQLIDARNDAHLWAQTYDRDLADVFAIQSEIAKAIADQLQAKLSPAEKKAIEQPPTTDLVAFDLYSRGKTLLEFPGNGAGVEARIREGIELLKRATAQDPTFHAAFCQLVLGNDRLYAEGYDHTPERLKAAELALSAAEQLKPDSPETHLARANHLYFGLRDYDGAQAQLDIAGHGLPNDSRIPELKGYIVRRKGNREEGLRLLKEATALDPRNVLLLQQIAASYAQLRRYAEEAEAYDRALEIRPDDFASRIIRTQVDWVWYANPAPMCQEVEQVRLNTPGSLSDVADNWFECALSNRDWAAAEQALAALGDNPCWADNGPIEFKRQFGEGLLARAMHDDARARQAFTAARTEQEQLVQKQKDYGPPLCVLGLIDAALGNKEAALQEGRRAMELLPREKDAPNSEALFGYFAVIAAWAGEKDLALQQLNETISLPGATFITSYGVLKLLPFWDPLRGDPRFEKIVASLAPK